jgi:hypothetical protein
MSDPYVNLFSSVAHPILTAHDVSKGIGRGLYESVGRNRPLKTACGHAAAQIVGSATARYVDSADDNTGYGFLQGKNMVVQSVVTSIVSGGLDSFMNRGSMLERFVVPFGIDAMGDTILPYLATSNPRIL